MAETWRPDPAKGIFETLLVLDGHPVELEAHLARLRAGLAALYPDLAAPDIPLGIPLDGDALRIDIAPKGDRLEARASMREVNRHPGVSLRSLPVPGGLGAHKWIDRSLLDETQAELPSDALPLLVDDDDSVLETSRANLFAVRDGVLLTPPTDGRILPGITRMRTLELADALGIETQETILSRDDLLAADEVFLTGSVRGIERAASLDGAPFAMSGEVTARLGAELRRRWSQPRATTPQPAVEVRFA